MESLGIPPTQTQRPAPLFNPYTVVGIVAIGSICSVIFNVAIRVFSINAATAINPWLGAGCGLAFTLVNVANRKAISFLFPKFNINSIENNVGRRVCRSALLAQDFLLSSALISLVASRFFSPLTFRASLVIGTQLGATLAALFGVVALANKAANKNA